VVQEITAAIFAMSEDEQIDLVTLAWLGRGDGSLGDWPELRAEAARAHNKGTASYLLDPRRGLGPVRPFVRRIIGNDGSGLLLLFSRYWRCNKLRGSAKVLRNPPSQLTI
jgi:hypothetical protein